MADKLIINDKPLTEICDVLRGTLYGSPDRKYSPSEIPVQIKIMPTIGSTFTGEDTTNAFFDGSFYGVYNNETITKLRSQAFANRKLTEVHLPNVTEVGDSAFASCKTLEAVDLPNLEIVGAAIFGGCSSIKRIELPKLRLLRKNYIGSGLFTNCTSLESVVLGDCATYEGYLPQEMFKGCTNLRVIYVPWSEDDIRNNSAPWGAPSNPTIVYNYTKE